MEAAAVRRRGLPLAPPPPDLVDLPLPGPEEGPFLRRRVRTRVRPRRRGTAHRLVVALQVTAVLLVAGLGAWMAYQRVMASERFRIQRVEVRGSHFLSEGEVRELLGPAVGERIFTLDIEALKARLRSSPWVADATVSRTLPDTLRVEIHERVPVALAEVDQLYLMDGNGDLVDVYGPRTGAFDLPIVRGLRGLDEAQRRERARRAGALLADLAELGQEISEVFVEPSGDLRVVLRGPGEVLLFGDPPYRRRFLTFLMLRRELAEKAPDAEHFDLRFRGRIYAKRPEAPPPDAGPTSTEPRGGAGKQTHFAAGAPPSLPAAEPMGAERGAIRGVPAASPPGRRIASDAPESRR